MNYFEPQSFERYHSRTIYEYLGVKTFKKYLITDGDLVRRWRGIKQISHHQENRIEELKKAVRETIKFEVIHLFFLLLSILIVVSQYQEMTLLKLSIIVVINLYANIYPIFLQRYNRIRLLRVLGKVSVQNNKAPS